MGAILSDWAPSLLNLGDVGSSYGLRSLGFVVAMSFCGLYDIFVMISVRVVSIWCNSMLLPSFLEEIVLTQVKVKSVNAPAHSCKLMRSYPSLQPVWAITDLSFVEECSSSVYGFRDDKVGVGDLDTSVRYINSDVERWLIVAKDKDEEDNDDDDDDDNEEEDDDEDDKGEEGPEDEDEGEEGLEGEGNDEDDEDDDDDEGNGGEEDDQDEGRDDEENGKEGDEDGEEEDGVEDEGNEGEDDDEEDEDEEPPKKRRK